MLSKQKYVEKQKSIKANQIQHVRPITMQHVTLTTTKKDKEYLIVLERKIYDQIKAAEV